MNHLVRIQKSDGTKEFFEEEKLLNSLKRSGASDQVAEQIVDKVENDIFEGMSTSDIYHRAFDLLRKHSLPVAVKYSIRRAMFELGPDGFPFERFIARIFQVQGYEAVTDQQVMGDCVVHEVDVVAWKEDKLAMAEVKFHNEFGLKSDLKVSLYVKARFDDLSGKDHEYGGKKRKLSERFLFTNTKFTETAITYGKCQNLNMISWNYPSIGNIHQLIEKYDLYPITCLTSLTHQQKKDLVAKGFLVCSDLGQSPDAILKDHGLSLSEITKIRDEIRSVPLLIK